MITIYEDEEDDSPGEFCEGLWMMMTGWESRYLIVTG